MAHWHLDAHASALFDRLHGDRIVKDLLGGFQDATGVRIWLAPLSPPSSEVILKHASGHPFCRAFVAVSDQATAHCLSIHSSLRAQPLKPGRIVRHTCAAGILHAALPLLVAKRPVALLLMSGIVGPSFSRAEAISNLERILEDGGYRTVLPAQVAGALEDTECRSSRQIDGLFQTAIALAFSLESRILCLNATPDSCALPATLVRAVDFLKKNFADSDRTAPENIATELGISPRWLRALFREYLGISLTDWLARLRVSIAMEKLRSSRKSIATIAWDCGFASLSPFYVAFRKHAKVTPSQWRAGTGSPSPFMPEEVLEIASDELLRGDLPKKPRKR